MSSVAIQMVAASGTSVARTNAPISRVRSEGTASIRKAERTRFYGLAGLAVAALPAERIDQRLQGQRVVVGRSLPRIRDAERQPHPERRGPSETSQLAERHRQTLETPGLAGFAGQVRDRSGRRGDV